MFSIPSKLIRNWILFLICAVICIISLFIPYKTTGLLDCENGRLMEVKTYVLFSKNHVLYSPFYYQCEKLGIINGNAHWMKFRERGFLGARSNYGEIGKVVSDMNNYSTYMDNFFQGSQESKVEKLTYAIALLRKCDFIGFDSFIDNEIQ